MKKKFFMKAAIAVIAMFTISLTAVAQQGDMAVGGNLVFGTGNSNLGIGAKFQYNVTNPLRLEGSFTYFPKKDYVTMWDLSANAHWLFPVADRVIVYPLAGLGYISSGASIGDSDFLVSVSYTELNLNLGGGVDFLLSDNLALNAELKFKTGGWGLLLSAGLAYKF